MRHVQESNTSTVCVCVCAGETSAGSSQTDPRLLAVFYDYIKLMPMVAEANQMSQELNKVSHRHNPSTPIDIHTLYSYMLCVCVSYIACILIPPRHLSTM